MKFISLVLICNGTQLSKCISCFLHRGFSINQSAVQLEKKNPSINQWTTARDSVLITSFPLTGLLAGSRLVSLLFIDLLKSLCESKVQCILQTCKISYTLTELHENTAYIGNYIFLILLTCEGHLRLTFAGIIYINIFYLGLIKACNGSDLRLRCRKLLTHSHIHISCFPVC